MRPSRGIAKIGPAALDLPAAVVAGELGAEIGQLDVGPVGDKSQCGVALAQIEGHRGDEIDPGSLHRLLIGEEPHRGEALGVGDTRGEQRGDVLLGEVEAAGERNPVGNLDIVVIDGHVPGAGGEHQAQGGVDRFLRGQRGGAFLLSDRVGRWQGGDVREPAHIELGGDVAQVGLPRRGHAEAGADRAADGDVVGDLQPRRELAVEGVAKVGVILKAQRGTKQQKLVHIRLDIDIGAIGAHGVVAGVAGLEAGEAVGANAKALGREVRVDEEGIGLAVADGEGLVAVLKAHRHVHAVHIGWEELPRQVEVHHPVGLHIAAGVVIGGNVVAAREQLRVDRVVDVEVRPALAGDGADVVEPARIKFAAHAAGEADVIDIAAELGREAAGEFFDQRVAIGIVADRGEGVGVGHVVGDADCRTVAGHVAAQVGHLHRGAAVGQRGAEKHAAPGVGVAEVEAAFHLPLGPVAEHIGFGAAAEVDAEVAEELEVVGNLRGAPDLRRRLAHAGIAGVDKALGVGALNAAAGGVLLLEFKADVGEAGVAEAETRVAGDCQRVAIALEMAAPLGVEGEARIVFLEHEIHDAGDGVGAVLRRGAVAQHFEPVKGDGRNHRQVRALGAAGNPRSEQGDDRGAVAALAIDEHEGGIGRQRAQGRGADQRRRVGNGLLGNIVGRHKCRKQRIHVAVALGEKVVAADDIDRDWGIIGGTVPAPGTHHQNLLRRLSGLARARGLGLGVGGEENKGEAGGRERENQPGKRAHFRILLRLFRDFCCPS